MKKTKVYLLDGGSICVDGLNFFYIQGPSGPYRFPVYSVLIDHEEGLFLFDTGFDGKLTSSWPKGPEPIMQTERQSLIGQLDLVGLKPANINIVMNSHYHFDHVGGNKLCTCATTICHKHELEAIANPHPAMEAPGYRDFSFLEASGDYKPKFEVVTGDIDVAKGVKLFETPGHTAGHYSLMVELSDRRPMIFTGDACYAKRSLEIMAIPALHVDPRKAYSSMERLRDLAQEHDAELFFAHDKESFPNYLKAPYYYS
ncbi:MAG: N-acyl homoserine lactonase family protein [Caulobacterales bacterium]